MNILFIYPVPPGWIHYYQGIGCLSALLKKHSHDTKLFIISDYGQGNISAEIDSYGPDLVCISCTTNQFELSCRVINFIYEKYHLPIVMGGVHPSFMPEESVSVRGTMAICIGEGEYPLLELAEAMDMDEDFTSIKNMWFDGGHSYIHNGMKRTVAGKGIIQNPVRSLIPNLDELPFPDREIFDSQIKSASRLDFIAGRGCPFNCSYCFNGKYRELFPEKRGYCRNKSVSNLISEILEVTGNYPEIRRVNFHDDTFNLEKKWLKDFCNQYASSVGIPFECSIEASLADEETFILLHKAKCFHVFVGVETGNEKLRKTVLNKKVSDSQIVNTFKWAKNYNISTTAHFMLGIPHESESSIFESVNLAREIKPDSLSVSLFYPYPGTELYNLCTKKGWISDRKTVSYFRDYVLDQPSISYKKVESCHKLFPYLVKYPMLNQAVKAAELTHTFAPLVFPIKALKKIKRLF